MTLKMNCTSLAVVRLHGQSHLCGVHCLPAASVCLRVGQVQHSVILLLCKVIGWILQEMG